MKRGVIAAVSLLVLAGCIELPPSARTRFHAAAGGGQPGGEVGVGGEGGEVATVGGGGQGGSGGGVVPAEPLPICHAGQTASADGCATIEQIAAGDTHTCVLASDGHVWCWGSNLHGEIGNPELPTTTHAQPQVVPGLHGVTELDAGTWHTCARVDTELFCWGGNERGQLGDGSLIDRDEPTKIELPFDVVQVSTRYRTTCVLTPDDEVHCWGFKLNGQIYYGTDITLVPVKVAGLDDLPGIAAIEVGSGHACAVASTREEVRCWGENSQGYLGDGSGVTSVSAVSVSDSLATPVERLALGAGFTCSIGGTPRGLQAWGNFFVVMGASFYEPEDFTTTPGTQVLNVDAGWAHMCQHEDDGFVRCLGQSKHGELGPTVALGGLSQAPVPIVGDVTLFAAGWQHNCALLGSGQLVCWGRNWRGQVAPDEFDAAVLPSPTIVSFDAP